MQLLKNPKLKDIFMSMAKASGQEMHEPTAEQARVVHAKSKYANKSGFTPPPLPSFKKDDKSSQAGILPTPLGRCIIIKEHVHAGMSAAGHLAPPPVHGKGKGKLIVAHPVLCDSSSDDEATLLAPLVPLHRFESTGPEIEVASESHSPTCSPAP